MSTTHKIASHTDWIEARRQLLIKEKEFARAREELNRLRSELPWEAVTKEYIFEGANGKQTLAELFSR